MKVFSVVLLFGLVVSISGASQEGNVALSGLSAGLSGLKELSGFIANGPGAVKAVAKKFGINVNSVVTSLEYWVKVLEGAAPKLLKLRIKQAGELLSKAAKVFGVVPKIDIKKTVKDLQDKIIPLVQLLLNTAKMILPAFKSL